MEPIMDFGRFTLSRGASWYQHYDGNQIDVYIDGIKGWTDMDLLAAVMDDFGDLVKVDRLMAEVS